jgi:hypothetical protein
MNQIRIHLFPQANIQAKDSPYHIETFELKTRSASAHPLRQLFLLGPELHAQMLVQNGQDWSAGDLATWARANRINSVRVLSTRELGVLCHCEYETSHAKDCGHCELDSRTRKGFGNYT